VVKSVLRKNSETCGLTTKFQKNPLRPKKTNLATRSLLFETPKNDLSINLRKMAMMSRNFMHRKNNESFCPIKEKSFQKNSYRKSEKKRPPKILKISDKKKAKDSYLKIVDKNSQENLLKNLSDPKKTVVGNNFDSGKNQMKIKIQGTGLADDSQEDSMFQNFLDNEDQRILEYYGQSYSDANFRDGYLDDFITILPNRYERNFDSDAGNNS
jgi:ribosomal protein S6E (S10)